MSDSVIKGERKASARPASPSSGSSSAARNRKPTSGTARAGTLAKSSPAGKTPARKAAKPSPSATPSKAKASASKQRPAAAKATKTVAARATAKEPSKSSAPDKRTKPATKRAPAKTASAPSKKTLGTKQTASAPQKKQASTPAKAKPTVKQRSASPVTSAKARPSRSAKATATSTKSAPSAHATPMQLVRQPTRDEAAALQAFERAHKEFSRGRFTEAANQFRSIIERFSVAEVTARARTYLAVAEARQSSEQVTTPETADALYDRGVLELNRANYIGAQELFERALGQDTAAPHIHYALAVTRARLGSRQPAFESLDRAIELQPNLRARAAQDADLSSLRNDTEFERIVFNSRS